MNKFIVLIALLAGPLVMHAQIKKATALRMAQSEVERAQAAYRSEAAAAWQSKTIRQGDKAMKFETKVFGQAQPGQRSLYISLHGGGGTTPEANDKQWQNQQRLYTPGEGLYFVPRAPTNTWNLWHEDHIDDMIDQVIKSAVILEGVDPNRVYLLGYSAGGDGLYQLAPRMADRFAAASMMAGHPGDASALPLRNLPFAIFMGAEDAAYDRNKHAAAWGKTLDSLQSADPQAYLHKVEIYQGLGHWMNRKDTVALAWMAGFKRTALPSKVIWVQDDRRHQQFYWLGATAAAKTGDKAVVSLDRKGNAIELDENTFATLHIYLNDDMLDLDKLITLRSNGKTLFRGKLKRSANLIKSSAERRLDASQVYSAGLQVAGGSAKPL
ncbi:alpha/beta hydrolase [Pedobacter yulinensis]|uniref:Alpha/beta hydrolase n=1 Tax=Pedobacter yulinensis TaxID=2126353 RepID=A0A2T3HIY9_9SPHI|nr:alpha/beta hydrolase [Pedobacter yulinensis]PST82400.1 alpha/beta hydrolase [Pedobacter yulinensis]